MYYLKNRYFSRWAKKLGIIDVMLLETISEFEKGLFEANLGNYLYKKRIAIEGRGKSSGVRAILFYQKDKKLIFIYGFEKNKQDNLSSWDFKYLNKLSNEYQNLLEKDVIKNIEYQKFFKIL